MRQLDVFAAGMKMEVIDTLDVHWTKRGHMPAKDRNSTKWGKWEKGKVA